MVLDCGASYGGLLKNVLLALAGAPEAAQWAAAHSQAPRAAAKQQQRQLEVRHSTSDLVHEGAPGPLPVT